MRLNPLALAITAVLASHAFATTPKPLCAEELAGIGKLDTNASGAIHGFNDQWRSWLQGRLASPTAPSTESVDRWVFALRAWNRLSPAERQSIAGEIGALIAGWDVAALESLEKTLAAYQLEVATARQRLALFATDAQSAVTAATGREAQLRPGPRPGWWTRWWDKTALPAWEDELRTHEQAAKALTAARNEHYRRQQIDTRLANVETDVKKLLLFVGSLKASSVDASTHPAIGKTLADASAEQTLALLTAIYLNEGVRLEPKANPVANAWIDLATHREKLRQALLEGNVTVPSLPSALGALFATDADVTSVEKRLDRILKSAGISFEDLQHRLDGIAEASEAAQELRVEYFEGLSAKIPFGQLAALADVVATIKQANAKELAAIRKYLAENKVTRRNAKSCWVNVRNQTARAAELAGQQLRVVKLERVLTVLKNPPKRVLRATLSSASTSSSSTTSSSDDFFTYYLIWYFLLHDSSPAGVHTAAHYTEPQAHQALDGKPLAEAPAVQPHAPAIQPVGDDFGGAKPGDFVPNDDGMCGIGKAGEFAPQLESGISLAGGETSAATIDFSQIDVGGSSGTSGLDLGTTSGGSYDYGGSSGSSYSSGGSSSYDYGSSSSSYDSGSSSYDSGSSSCGGGDF